MYFTEGPRFIVFKLFLVGNMIALHKLNHNCNPYPANVENMVSS